jgi:thymidine kinase
MSKLYFNYGTVSSSKTLNLLAVYKNYELQGRSAILIRPAMDTRSNKVESRAGLSAVPDITLEANDNIIEKITDYIIVKFCNIRIDKPKIKTIKELQEVINKVEEAVIVDEAQFLSVDQIKDLRKLSAIGEDIELSTKNDCDQRNILLDILDDSIINDKTFVSFNICLPVMCYGLRTNSDGELWDAASVLMAQSDEISEIKTICSYCSRRAVFSAINPERACNNNDEVINPSWGLYVPVCPAHFAEIQAKLNKLH